jgi:hypothetical protein
MIIIILVLVVMVVVVVVVGVAAVVSAAKIYLLKIGFWNVGVIVSTDLD